VHALIPANSSFDKVLLSIVKGFRTNGLGVSSGKVILFTFLTEQTNVFFDLNHVEQSY
jgi:hypothetical protein